VAYDEQLLERVRAIIDVRPDVTEGQGFGVFGWSLRGHLAVGVTRGGGLLVRVEPEEMEMLLRQPNVSSFGRPGVKPMQGFVLVEALDLSDEELADWVERGADRAMTLPPK
jgi:hypothetical protein